jgi:hypothetical protein
MFIIFYKLIILKIISEIFGGLGNQMFQYACGKAVANRLGSRLYLDVSWFDSGNRVFMLDIFPNISYSPQPQRNYIARKVAALSKKIPHRTGVHLIRDIYEPDYFYWPGVEQIKSSVRLSGYWQNEKYFSNISSIIRKDFMFPEFNSLEANNIAKKIKETPCPVSIHVRRGDYVENPKINSVHGVCSPDYYKKALQIIIDKYKGEKNPELYIFSDDPDWVKNNFYTYGLPSVTVDIQEHKDKPYQDMHLMSLCKHHIIANSSFSWWGAWLSSMNGIVVAPKRWFAEDTMKNCNPSLASWITI